MQALASQTPACPLVKTHWLVQPERIKQLAEIIAAADTILFNAACMRNGFLENVRFDAPPDDPVDQGLSLASLELKRPDALALRLMAHLPDRLLQWVQVGRAFAKPTRQLVHSAAGLCLGVAADHRPETDFAVGRAMQRAWLALTEQQLAVQPMMSLAVLENARRHGSPEIQHALGEARLRSLSDAWRQAVPEMGQGRPAFLLRFGLAGPPAGRTGRLPLPAVLPGPGHKVPG